jgi:hypothetical protein
VLPFLKKRQIQEVPPTEVVTVVGELDDEFDIDGSDKEGKR